MMMPAYSCLLRRASMLGLAAMLSGSALAPSAQAGRHDWRDDDRHDWREDRREERHGKRGWHRGHVVVHEYPRYTTDYYYPRRHHGRPVYTYADSSVTYGAPTQVVCSTNYDPLVTIAGGVGGGVIGAQIGRGHGRTAAIITGTLLGGALGNRYTYADQVCTRRVFETAEVGRPLYWTNRDTGYQYTVTPVRDYRDNNGYCREYTATAVVGGRPQETYGTACYKPDGSWQIVN